MNEQPKKIPKVRDSATLVLWRKGKGGWVELLMGRRTETTGPWANTYVFPGGAVDPGDVRARAARELPEAVARRLEVRGGRSRALAMAAIRETFEETGLLLGQPDPDPLAPVPESWRAFFSTGLAPDLGGIDYALRAVTPVARPKRFNSRFLIADGAHAVGHLAGSGELVDLGWYPLVEVPKLKLPNITATVLGDLSAAIAGNRKPGDPVPVYTVRNGKRHIRPE